jgi:hypothetical protein
MAVTITRTPWIDDDGTGTTGTVINNAVKTALYNDIDGALAKVAQLAGGNAFVGQQTTNGQVYINNGANTTMPARLQILSNQGTLWGIGIQSQVDTANGLFIGFMNQAGAAQGSITALSGATSVAYNTTSDRRLKDDAGRATDLSALRRVVVHDFAWKADGGRDRGVFAQDAHALYPRAVTPGTDETTKTGDLVHPWMTDYSKFVPDLIVGWQQHDALLEELLTALRHPEGALKGSRHGQ